MKTGYWFLGAGAAILWLHQKQGLDGLGSVYNRDPFAARASSYRTAGGMQSSITGRLVGGGTRSSYSSPVPSAPSYATVQQAAAPQVPRVSEPLPVPAAPTPVPVTPTSIAPTPSVTKPPPKPAAPTPPPVTKTADMSWYENMRNEYVTQNNQSKDAAQAVVASAAKGIKPDAGLNPLIVGAAAAIVPIVGALL